MPILTCEKIKKSFGGTEVLKSISLEVERERSFP